MQSLTKMISGWGRYPVQSCEIERPERYAQLRGSGSSIIARGQGRSYGDASLNDRGRVLLTERVNRLLELDTVQGILRAEAGVTLADVLQVIVPKGWFLPVTPGTKFASLGGCVAADVHGKNHHLDGSFGEHVLSLEMILADGNIKVCSPTMEPALFWATVGGMGLTGIIGEVTVKLIPLRTTSVLVKHQTANNLEELFCLLANPALDDKFSVAWIDTMARGAHLGRSISMSGHHCEHTSPRNSNQRLVKGGPGASIPFNFPAPAMNKIGISAFNSVYYKWAASKRDPFIADFDSFFYPLDAVGHMNRIYGRNGFVQYQCVIPESSSFEGIHSLLKAISDSSQSSFLAVLKRLGPEGSGMLSFPMAGYTLALDMPVRGHGLFALLDKLDQIVLGHGGRVYLAKDARLSAESFRTMYPRYSEWLAVKRCFDLDNRFTSSLARRLQIGE